MVAQVVTDINCISKRVARHLYSSAGMRCSTKLIRTCTSLQPGHVTSRVWKGIIAPWWSKLWGNQINISRYYSQKEEQLERDGCWNWKWGWSTVNMIWTFLPRHFPRNTSLRSTEKISVYGQIPVFPVHCRLELNISLILSTIHPIQRKLRR